MTSEEPEGHARGPRGLNGRAKSDDAPEVTSILDDLLDSLGRPSSDDSPVAAPPVEPTRSRFRLTLGEARAPSSAKSERGPDARATIILPPERARFGMSCPVAFTVVDVCAACGGEGCGNCGGSGRAEVGRDVHLRIPPGLTDGAELRVLGQGSLPAGEGLPGDLVVTISVPPVRDDRLVRRFAVLSVIAALAFLVYVVLTSPPIGGS